MPNVFLLENIFFSWNTVKKMTGEPLCCRPYIRTEQTHSRIVIVKTTTSIIGEFIQTDSESGGLYDLRESFAQEHHILKPQITYVCIKGERAEVLREAFREVVYMRYKTFTARDYLHFEQILVNKGELFGNRILKPEFVEMMSKSQIGDLYAKGKKGVAGMAHGYTVAITVDPNLAKNGRSPGSFGWGGAAGTVSWTDPKEKLAVVIMVQQPGTGLPKRVAEAIKAAIVD